MKIDILAQVGLCLSNCHTLKRKLIIIFLIFSQDNFAAYCATVQLCVPSALWSLVATGAAELPFSVIEFERSTKAKEQLHNKEKVHTLKNIHHVNI